MKAKYKTVYWGDPKYKVGSDGTFWSKKRYGKWLRRKACRLSKKDDRLGVSVKIEGKLYFIQVCHLVLRTFVGPCPKGMEACHFPDRSLENNCLNNLRWDTRKNNFRDRDFHGTTARGVRHAMSKLTDAEVLKIRRIWNKYVKLYGKKTDRGWVLPWGMGVGRKLANKFKVDQSLIYMIARRQLWSHV